MTARVAILSPAAGGEWRASRWPSVLERMARPLAAAGIAVEEIGWNAGRDLAGLDLVMPLVAWGYHVDPGWAAQVRAWQRQQVRLANPAEVLLWNADKIYLDRLAARGVPTLPTSFVDAVDAEAMAAAAARFGTERLVAKPRVSGGAYRTIRWAPGDSLDDGPRGAAMVQPYLGAVESAGEVSLIYLGGAFSHAVRKVPQPGDFRVQPEYDGIITPHDPDDAERAVADAALAAADSPLLYARVDLVRDDAGRPLLIELELVEPDLYLGHDADAPGRFAAAVAGAARR